MSMTDLQKQAKEAADGLEGIETRMPQSELLALLNSINFLRKIERGEMREVVRCSECVYRGNTNECLMNYTCSTCKGQWSWETDNDFCSAGRRKSHENG